MSRSSTPAERGPPAPGGEAARAPSASRWTRWFTGRAAVAGVLALFFAAMPGAWRDKSATFDEPGHAAAGLVYWKYGDFRFDPENGNLPQRWYGLALQSTAHAIPAPGSPGWSHADVWTLADAWLNRSGNDTRRILARGRTAASVFAVVAAALVWAWSRRLFGPVGAMISLLVFVLNPTVLAHGALMTSDMAAALFFTLAVAGFAAALRRVSPGRILLGGLALGGLFITKMSAPLVLPVLLLLALGRGLDSAPLERLGGAPVQGRRRKLLVLGGVAVAHGAITLGVTWAAFGFRFHATASGEPSRFHVPWPAVLRQASLEDLLAPLPLSSEQKAKVQEIRREHDVAGEAWTYRAIAALEQIKSEVLAPAQRAAVEAAALHPASLGASIIQWMRQTRLLPEAYLYGLAHVWVFTPPRAAYLNGQVSETGWRRFLPYAFAVKTPLAALALFALACFLAGRALTQRRALAAEWSPLLLLIAVYGGAAIASRINLGLRHLLPVLPALCILTGAIGVWLNGEGAARRWPRLAVAGLLLVLSLEVAVRSPHHLAYFNGLVRARDGYRHLIDSSLDWGQELPAVKRAVDAEPPGMRCYLAYFGTASPLRHGVHARPIFAYLDLDRAESPPLKRVSGPQDDASLRSFLDRHPDYDPALVYPLRTDDGRVTLFVQRANALRLDAGAYYISASLLPPVHYPQAHGLWSEQHEVTYRQLRELTRPLLSDDRAIRAAAIRRLPPETWNRVLRDFAEHRFARLTAWLRRHDRRPDAQVNHAVLVFRLTTAEIEAALEGPSPAGG